MQSEIEFRVILRDKAGRPIPETEDERREAAEHFLNNYLGKLSLVDQRHLSVEVSVVSARRSAEPSAA